MKIRTGHNGSYFWIETSSKNRTISGFIDNFSHFILNKHLAIISFDSGTFIPTDDDIMRGWRLENEIAYFDCLNVEELNRSIFDNFDQWFIFDSPTKVNSIDTFVNYSGFSIDTNLVNKDPLKLSIANKFWETIDRVKPSRFLQCGDNFIYGSTAEIEINEVEKAWCT